MTNLHVIIEDFRSRHSPDINQQALCVKAHPDLELMTSISELFSKHYQPPCKVWKL